MRSAPTLNSCTMPFSSVAMIEKLALVRIAFSSAPSFRRASAECGRRTASGLEASLSAVRPPLWWNMGSPLVGSSDHGSATSAARMCGNEQRIQLTRHHARDVEHQPLVFGFDHAVAFADDL